LHEQGSITKELPPYSVRSGGAKVLYPNTPVREHWVKIVYLSIIAPLISRKR